MNMIIFVREKATGRYAGEHGAWVTELDEAKIFRCSIEAADFCYKRQLHQGAEIVLRTGAKRYDLAVDVPPIGPCRIEVPFRAT